MPIDLTQFRYDSKHAGSGSPSRSPPPSEVRRKAQSPGEIPPLLKPNLLLVFTGFNPGTESGRTGHHYAHGSNRFWRFLYESGLTRDKLSPEQDVELPDSYRYGFTDLVARCTAGITQLSKKERLEGAALLEQRLMKYRPKYVAFVGKGIWDTVCAYKGWRNKNFQYGLQEHTFGTKVVVLPSSSGLVSIAKDVQLVWWNKLRELVDAEREKQDRGEQGEEDQNGIESGIATPKRSQVSFSQVESNAVLTSSDPTAIKSDPLETAISDPPTRKRAKLEIKE